MAYQSLYRRYRPQKFSEIHGQPHIVTALRNAVATDQVGHAYLFHGPRGTGKTSSARVLAKALNCEQLGEDSEPCGTCESCVAIEQGRSFDLHELDAASNNGVEDMRDLLGKVNLGNPGRMKVYILDEVHMLTRGAENSLLKTLEEPPGHVVWVLATTEPHKVVETVRSRCQVFELGLLGAEEMTAHVRWIIDDSGLEVDDSAVDYVVSVGGGSVRDTLSALDRVVAAGGVADIDQSTEQLLQALADKDTAAALSAVGDALGRGRDPRSIGEMSLAGMRNAFLTRMGSPPPRITVAEQERASAIAEQMTPPQLTSALETLGAALVEMRQAPDPRVHLEVALVRLCRSTGDASVDSLLERIEQLESQLAAGGGPSPVSAPGPVPEVEREPSEPRQFQASDGSPKLPPAPRPNLPPPPQPTSPPSPQPTLPPPPTPVSASRTGDKDIRSLEPQSPTDVVHLAGLHLSLGRDLVIGRAKSLLGPSEGERSIEDLKRLWESLVDDFGPDSAPDGPPLTNENPPSGQDDAAPSPPQPPNVEVNDTEESNVEESETVEEPQEEPYVEEPQIEEPQDMDDGEPGDSEPDDGDSLDLDALIDASSHTDQVVELLAEAFPGAEVETPSQARVDQ